MTMLAKTTEKGGVLTLADYEARIHLYKEQIGTGYIGIGRTLNEAKEAGVVPHGQWESWVTQTTGLTPRQAQRCMQAATEIRDGSALARLEMSKALMLLGSGLDEDTREEMAGKAADEGATVKALREEIRQAKLKAVQEAGAATEMRIQLEKVQGERESLRQQIQATISGYQRRMDEETDRAYQQGMKDSEKEARETVREEFARKIDYINGERERANAQIRDLREQLAAAEQAGSARWDEGYRRGSAQGAEDAEKRIAGLRNELNKQTQYAADLKRELDEMQGKSQDADREMLLAAAEEAEKRAADAEAELEALRAGKAAEKMPPVVILGKAVSAFFSECELMPFYPEDLTRDRQALENLVGQMADWCGRMADAIQQAAVEAEGAVE